MTTMMDEKQSMNRLADCHMHTAFSSDSETPMEEMVKGAIALGIPRITITDHHDMDYPTGEFQIDVPTYVNAVLEMKEKYQKQIDIRLGIEMGLQTHLQERILEIVDAYPFDCVIGSVHLLDGIDPYFREQVKTTDRELYRKFFEYTLECVEKLEGYQTQGHLDYIVRYGYHKEQEYDVREHMDIIDAILKKLIDRQVALEINTAAWKYGMTYSNPHPMILKRYHELGGEMITVGGDAHKPEHIAYDFHRVAPVLKEAGFRYVTEFVEKKPQFFSIENM